MPKLPERKEHPVYLAMKDGYNKHQLLFANRGPLLACHCCTKNGLQNRGCALWFGICEDGGPLVAHYWLACLSVWCLSADPQGAIFKWSKKGSVSNKYLGSIRHGASVRLWGSSLLSFGLSLLSFGVSVYWIFGDHFLVTLPESNFQTTLFGWISGSSSTAY